MSLSKYSAIIPNITNIKSFNNCEIINETIHFTKACNGSWNITLDDNLNPMKLMHVNSHYDYDDDNYNNNVNSMRD